MESIAFVATETIVPAVTSRQLFEDERAYAEYLHRHEIELEERHHVAEQRQAAELHQAKLAYDTELFLHDMHIDIGLATRDATRDAIRQCSQAASTFVMCDALLLNCVFQVVSQLNIPATSAVDGSGDGAGSPSSSVAIAVLSALLAAAFAALAGSVVLCLRLQRVVNAYNLSRQLMRYQPCGRTHCNFNDYFDCHCRGLEVHSRGLCVAGAVCTVLSSGAWAYVNILVEPTKESVGRFIAFAALPTVGIALLVVGHWIAPDATREGRRDFVGMASSLAHLGARHTVAPVEQHRHALSGHNPFPPHDADE